jgi:hypothetical protein
MTRKETISTLNLQYERICTGYIDEFIKKQKINFDYNIAQESGNIVKYFEHYYFSISDIVYDLTNKCAKGLIYKWEAYNKKEKSCQWSYEHYCKRLRKRHKQVENVEVPCQVTLLHNGVVVSR